MGRERLDWWREREREVKWLSHLRGKDKLAVSSLLGRVAHLLDGLPRHKVFPLARVPTHVKGGEDASADAHVQLEHDALDRGEVIEPIEQVEAAARGAEDQLGHAVRRSPPVAPHHLQRIAGELDHVPPMQEDAIDQLLEISVDIPGERRWARTSKRHTAQGEERKGVESATRLPVRSHARDSKAAAPSREKVCARLEILSGLRSDWSSALIEEFSAALAVLLVKLLAQRREPRNIDEANCRLKVFLLRRLWWLGIRHIGIAQYNLCRAVASKYLPSQALIPTIGRAAHEKRRHRCPGR